MIPSQNHFQACKFLLLSFHCFHRKLSDLLAGRAMTDTVILEVGRKAMAEMPEFSLREIGWNVLERWEIQHYLPGSYFLANSIPHRALESHPREFSYRGICVGIYAEEIASLPGSIHTQLLSVEGWLQTVPSGSWGLRSPRRLRLLKAKGFVGLPSCLPLVTVGAARK